jgi:hypothetical protein
MTTRSSRCTEDYERFKRRIQKIGEGIARAARALRDAQPSAEELTRRIHEIGRIMNGR